MLTVKLKLSVSGVVEEIAVAISETQDMQPWELSKGEFIDIMGKMILT